MLKPIGVLIRPNQVCLICLLPNTNERLCWYRHQTGEELSYGIESSHIVSSTKRSDLI